jgi:hypothetical protein
LPRARFPGIVPVPYASVFCMTATSQDHAKPERHPQYPSLFAPLDLGFTWRIVPAISRNSPPIFPSVPQAAWA